MKNFELIKGAGLPVARWSGGTTTQLAIFPTGADYASRDFVWRVSTAVVETPESVFTPLPGVARVIMVLEGRMILTHERRYSRELGPFEQDGFMGDWTTRSRSSGSAVSKGGAAAVESHVRDFNVMVKGGEATLEVVETEDEFAVVVGDSVADGRRACDSESVVIYFLKPAAIEVEEQMSAAEKGDVFVATVGGGESLRLSLRDIGGGLRALVAKINHG